MMFFYQLQYIRKHCSPVFMNAKIKIKSTTKINTKILFLVVGCALTVLARQVFFHRTFGRRQVRVTLDFFQAYRLLSDEIINVNINMMATSLTSLLKVFYLSRFVGTRYEAHLPYNLCP